MRKVLFFICIAIMGVVVACNAQNGGQLNENPSVKMEFVNKIGNVITFKITNKQDCTAEIQTKCGNNERIKLYNPLSADTIKLVDLSGTNTKIQSKALTVCGTTDYGQVELFLNINDLPVRIVNIRVKLNYKD